MWLPIVSTGVFTYMEARRTTSTRQSQREEVAKKKRTNTTQTTIHIRFVYRAKENNILPFKQKEEKKRRKMSVKRHIAESFIWWTDDLRDIVARCTGMGSFMVEGRGEEGSIHLGTHAPAVKVLA